MIANPSQVFAPVFIRLILIATVAIAIPTPVSAQEKIKISGVYPHLAHTNNENEVGIGAVVPWAGSLWTNTYGPHKPHGSSDKLRRIDENWNVYVHADSVGGTPANRMIHLESNQLLMGHHLIDSKGNVRTIDPKRSMPGRLTANARHLTDPENRCYYFTMENGVYEVDVHTLAVKAIVRDPINIRNTHLPGYHGKGAYTGCGRVIISNNGEPNQTSPSGCLASWNGVDWTIIARNQFVEVSGPGGLSGNEAGENRVWAVGWDSKSVRLFLLENGQWTKFRLPKGSYTHDANHGWNTEWPRIREVKPGLTLMHMHGLFFKFPKTFSQANFGGIEPISTYVKMPVDYAWFNDQLVIAKDDASKFDNAFVEQSQSNLWIGRPEQLENWGPKNGFGGVWLDDSFDANEVSEPFLVAGFKNVNLHLHHKGGYSCTVELQIDQDGTGKWQTYTTIKTAPRTGYTSLVINDLNAQWVRLVAKDATDKFTAYFHLTTPNIQRDAQTLFKGLANLREPAPNGATLQLPNGYGMKLNVFSDRAQYQVEGNLEVKALKSTKEVLRIKESIRITPDRRVGVDKASAFVRFKGKNDETITLRLPKDDLALDSTVGNIRHIREIVTERSALNLHGTFYEVPRPKPGKFLNFWQMKPIASHNKHIFDFCSWRGLLVLSGAKQNCIASNHVTVGSTGLWLGEVDDLWKFGKPHGKGGPWLNSEVKRNQPSDPYLMLGYENKSLSIVHGSQQKIQFTLEVDFLGTGEFVQYLVLTVEPGKVRTYRFDQGFSAHWIRLRAKSDTTATAQLIYE